MSTSSSITPGQSPTFDAEYEQFLKDELEETVAKPHDTDEDLVAEMHRIRDLRTEKEELETRLKAVNVELKDRQARVLATFDTRGILRMKTGAGTFYIQSQPHPNIKDKSRFIEWLDAEGFGEYAPRTVNFMTIRSWWKERLELGAELPSADIAEAYIDRSIRVRK